jgi:hypothetical protein
MLRKQITKRLSFSHVKRERNAVADWLGRQAQKLEREVYIEELGVTTEPEGAAPGQAPKDH